MKTTTLARIAVGLFIAAFAPLSAVQAKEDNTRCDCYYKGYDAYVEKEGERSCTNPALGSTLDECDRDKEQKKLWGDGCLAHHLKEERKCPYKSAGGSR